MPAPAWSMDSPSPWCEGVAARKQGQALPWVLMTEGLVFLSVEVAAWDCQAHDIPEEVQGVGVGGTFMKYRKQN